MRISWSLAAATRPRPCAGRDGCRDWRRTWSRIDVDAADDGGPRTARSSGPCVGHRLGQPWCRGRRVCAGCERRAQRRGRLAPVRASPGTTRPRSACHCFCSGLRFMASWCPPATRVGVGVVRRRVGPGHPGDRQRSRPRRIRMDLAVRSDAASGRRDRLREGHVGGDSAASSLTGWHAPEIGRGRGAGLLREPGGLHFLQPDFLCRRSSGASPSGRSGFAERAASPPGHGFTLVEDHCAVRSPSVDASSVSMRLVAQCAKLRFCPCVMSASDDRGEGLCVERSPLRRRRLGSLSSDARPFASTG